MNCLHLCSHWIVLKHFHSPKSIYRCEELAFWSGIITLYTRIQIHWFQLPFWFTFPINIYPRSLPLVIVPWHVHVFRLLCHIRACYFADFLIVRYQNKVCLGLWVMQFIMWICSIFWVILVWHRTPLLDCWRLLYASIFLSILVRRKHQALFERFSDILPGNNFLEDQKIFFSRKDKTSLELEKISTGWDAEWRLRRRQR